MLEMWLQQDISSASASSPFWVFLKQCARMPARPVAARSTEVASTVCQACQVALHLSAYEVCLQRMSAWCRDICKRMTDV